MRTNYVLIDHENVQPTILPALKQLGCKVWVFVGANQTKMSFETAAALQVMGDDARYVKITGNGPNALDLHIAFYIGKISQQNPDSFFYVISKDTGFDPLIEHLKGRSILAARSASIAEIPLLKIAAKAQEEESQREDRRPADPPLLKSSIPLTIADKRALIATRLYSFGKSKPGSVKTLTSTIHAIFQRQISEAEASALVKSLEKVNLIKIDGTRIVYSLPELPAPKS